MTDENATSLSYATPAPRPAARTWAATMILFAGLGLVVVGGCFCMGILMIVEQTGFNGQPTTMPVSSGDRFLAIVFSLLAAASFAGGAVLICLGTKALLKIARS